MKALITALLLTTLFSCQRQQATWTDYLNRIQFDSCDVQDIRALKDTITGAPVVATDQTWKAWSLDVEIPVSTGDTVDWVRMEVLFAE